LELPDNVRTTSSI